jgi:RNA polymerase sigma-70 factor (ECF subfamily)
MYFFSRSQQWAGGVDRCAAIASLPDKQAKHIYVYYFMDISKSAIAKAQGVSESGVRDGINEGYRISKSF